MAKNCEEEKIECSRARRLLWYSYPRNSAIALAVRPRPRPVFRLNIMRQALLEYCSPLQCFALAMVFSGFALVVILMAMFYTTVAPRCATSCGFSTTSIAGPPASESIAANADAATSAGAAASEAV